MPNKSFSRCDFLKLLAAGLSGLALHPFAVLSPFADFPKSERLGRVATTQMDLKTIPGEGSAMLRKVYEDTIVPMLTEVVGPKLGRINQRWVDTGEGYLWSPDLQPVKNIPNAPVGAFPANSR